MTPAEFPLMDPDKSKKFAFEKFPRVDVPGDHPCARGWPAVITALAAALPAGPRRVLAVETYPGVRDAELLGALQGLQPDLLVDAARALADPATLQENLAGSITDDPIFGRMNDHSLAGLFCPEKLATVQEKVTKATGLIILYGTGATLLGKADRIVYADMARWEIQQRMRAGETGNPGLNDAGEKFSLLYKKAYFVFWRMADEHKKPLLGTMDFYLDSNRRDDPALVSGAALRAGLAACVGRPFSLVPFFDPGPWGGQWMRRVCDLDDGPPNYAWCFNCVPEENSLLLAYGDGVVETPAINLVFHQPQALLGEDIFRRFGAEFPIRFDFLDTMAGGNLSLQVHPLEEQIRDEFAMPYTQDESYYILDAEEGAQVYLGLREGIQPDEMLGALETAAGGGPEFDTEKFVQTWPAERHDHFLIPAGTVHCSGAGCMVLEVSATPYIFTFKLWDWNRPGLDGKPRPINIDRGRRAIQWDRTTDWTAKELVNRTRAVNEGDGWREESTGLHELEFIETRRHWFTGTVPHDTEGTLQVVALVHGDQALVESPEGAFAPFPVGYAETFVIPAAVGPWTIRPWGRGAGQECATLKAVVRREQDDA